MKERDEQLARAADVMANDTFGLMMKAEALGSQRFLIVADLAQENDHRGLDLVCRSLHEPVKVGRYIYHTLRGERGFTLRRHHERTPDLVRTVAGGSTLAPLAVWMEREWRRATFQPVPRLSRGARCHWPGRFIASQRLNRRRAA